MSENTFFHFNAFQGSHDDFEIVWSNGDVANGEPEDKGWFWRMGENTHGPYKTSEQAFRDAMDDRDRRAQ